mgnify:CR=1 FL=1
MLREMKKPFGFAKELLRYSWGELSGDEKESVEEMLSKVRGLEELAGELRDKERVGSELRAVGSFDVEKALVRLKKRQRGKKRLFLGGCVSCGYGGNFCIFVVEPGDGYGEFIHGRKNRTG